MSASRSPARWVDDPANAPEGFERAVDRDESAGPSAAQLERVLGGVSLELGRPELLQAYRRAFAQSSPARTKDVLPTSKLAFGTLVVVLCGAVAWLALRDRARPEPRRELAPQSQTSSGAPSIQTPPAPAAPRAPPPIAKATLNAAPIATPRMKNARVRTPQRAAEHDDPGAELALLEPAQKRLPDQPGRSLALAEQHRARFPHGQFEQEREMLAIEALVALGRNAEAVRRAHAFERHHPDSSHLPRLRDLLRTLP